MSSNEEKIPERNSAFIDGQNLHLGTKSRGWRVDHFKFRRYLKDKYHVEEAYYFLGFTLDTEQGLYDNLQKAGFILIFREHTSALKGKKKGNVDSDIILSICQKMYEKVLVGKVILVSGDGDYKKLVNFLIKHDRFKKILFPNKEFASSLYESLGGERFSYLEDTDVKRKISL